MGDDFLKGIPIEYIPSILKKQIKDFKRTGRTVPYHLRGECEDRPRCAWHEKEPQVNETEQIHQLIQEIKDTQIQHLTDGLASGKYTPRMARSVRKAIKDMQHG
jgi:hypothetical protein